MSSPPAKRLKPTAPSTSPPRPGGQPFQTIPTLTQIPTIPGAAIGGAPIGNTAIGSTAIGMPPGTAPASGNRKRRRDSGNTSLAILPTTGDFSDLADTSAMAGDQDTPNAKQKRTGRTNTPWTPAEEQKLKTMRDAGNSWGDIAKQFPQRTEGSVKKHWYKDMHYAEFAETESNALREAIREYEQNKWKVIGQKVGKPAKACEQYAKENFKDLK